MNITLTENARERFNELNANNVRLYIQSYSWCGVSLGVLPDIERENDEKIAIEELTFLVDKGLLEIIKGDIRVDFIKNGLKRGFKVYQ